ncbi:putative MFS transporter [Colletotrichum asianum]
MASLTDVQDEHEIHSRQAESEKHDRYQSTVLEAVGDHARVVDPEIEARVVRKIDLFLMPAMVIGYGLVYYDKAILGSAALFGMTADLQLSIIDSSVTPPKTDTTRLSWATSIFYFGQLIGSYPMTYLLQRFNTRWTLGPVVMIWAIICAATAGVTSWQGLLVQRFFLGFTESIIPTAFMRILYPKRTSPPAELVVFGHWMVHNHRKRPELRLKGGALAPWQYIYVLAGGLTFLFGIWCFFLPNSPLTAWFLKPEERTVAVERLRRGQTGVKNQTIKGSQIKEAVLDPKVWLVALTMASGYTVNGAVSGFGPLIVSTFGYSALDSILFQFPLGAICAIGIPLTGWLCSKYRNIRIITLIICTPPVIAGFVTIWKSEWGVRPVALLGLRPVAPVVGYSLIGFFGPVVSLTVTLGASNVAGETKKSFMASAVFVAYCVGNIVGPQLVRSETKAQHYPELWSGLIICYCITIVSASALYVLLWKENKRRDSLDLDEGERDRLAFKNLTDKENLHFRYVL